MITSTSTKKHFKTQLTDGQHTFYADVPVSSGGTGQDMRPGDIWASGLAACLNITTQKCLMRENFDYEQVQIHIDMNRDNPEKVIFKVKIEIDGNILPHDKERICQEVKNCAVCKLMTVQKEFIFE